MTSPLIQIAGIVLKRSGSSWAVGDACWRMIRKRPTIEVECPSYFTKLEYAFQVFVGRVEARVSEGRCSDIDHLMADFVIETVGRTFLESPDLVTRWIRSQSGLSETQFAMRADIARSTLHEIEAGRSDPKLSTVRSILSANESEYGR